MNNGPNGDVTILTKGFEEGILFGSHFKTSPLELF
jgi:hypothetical protein